jgi:membrane protein implicated in regulation of membrane protease activity
MGFLRWRLPGRFDVAGHRSCFPEPTSRPQHAYVGDVEDWVIWLVVAGGLLVAELFTLTFVLGLLAAAAAVTAGAAAVGVPTAGQIAVFGVGSAVGYVLVRPFERQHQRRPGISTGTAALEGRRAIVTEAISDGTGRVKLGGESWAARALTPGTTVAIGASVVVNAVDGATVVVFPEEI